MSIPMVGAAGDLFNRIGALGGILYSCSLNQHQVVDIDAALLNAQYTGTDADLINTIAPNLATYVQTATAFDTAITGLANATLQRMVFKDVPAQSTTITNCLKEIIRQMVAGSVTVQKAAVTTTPSTQSGIHGDGVLISSALRGDGLSLENTVAEVMSITCSSDAQSGSATLGQEKFSVLGQPIGNDNFFYTWPQGSNANTTISAVSPLVNNSGNQLLYNGSFTNFTTNTPNNFIASAGTPGTDFKGSTGQVYNGTNSLQFVGGGTAPVLYQQFGASSSVGTPATLSPNTQYGCSVRVYADVQPSAGVITFELVGGATSGSVSTLTDAQGTACSFTVNLHTQTAASWIESHGTFRTPTLLPAFTAFRIRTSTGISSGTNVWIANLGFGQMAQLYAGGPQVILFSGSTQFLVNDRFLLTNTNDRGGSNYLASFQGLFDRLFSMRTLANTIAGGLLLPSSNSPTVSDSLITSGYGYYY